LVFFDRVVDEIPVHKVLTDDFQAGYLASRHLIDNGCRNIVFLSIGESLNIMKRRNLGSAQSIKESPQKIKYKTIDCTSDPEQAYKIIKKHLQSKSKPDGIIGAVEKLAITTYLVCQDLKIKVPEQLKVVAFSNLPIAELLNPGLTTIRQPAYEIGRTAAELLFEGLMRLRSPYTPKSITLPSLLEARASSIKS
jgi:LacI family transcriptional regulator